MKFFIYLILFTVVAVFGLTFTLKNAQPVALHYYPDFVLTAPLSIVLLATLLIGTLFGMFVTWTALLHKKRELSRARKEIARLDEEIQNLRNIPIKEQA
jgi:uncharacterized integral membrane protein